MAGPRRCLPAGTHGLLIDAPDEDPATLADALRAGWAGAGPVEVVPGAATVLVVVRRPEDLAGLRALVADLAPVLEPPRVGRDAPEVVIDVDYGGPDLDAVAAAVAGSPDEVVALHSGAPYRVAFCGFAPGFAYLAGLPARLHLPRRPTPRAVVPPGAVAVADTWSAVYPRATPGGWHLLGTTSATIWDPGRHTPALLAPGTRVRFRPR